MLPGWMMLDGSVHEAQNQGHVGRCQYDPWFPGRLL